MASGAVGVVAAIRRYPVKSLLGEALGSARVETRGLRGDRLWAVRDVDGRFGSGKSTRRFRRIDGLFELRAHYEGAMPVVTFPDGRAIAAGVTGIDAALSDYVGQPVTLAEEGAISHFDEGPVHLLTTASVAHFGRLLGSAVDHRRFRANLLVETPGLDGFVETSWTQARLAVGGEVVLRVVKPMVRCVMINNAQEELPEDRRLLGAIRRFNDLNLGVLADVMRGGVVSAGDAVELLDLDGRGA